MILLAVYIVLGTISSFLIYTSAWGLNDVSISADRPWYENLLSFFVILFGYSFTFIVVSIVLVVGSPFWIIGYFVTKKQDESEKHRRENEIKKFEEWKALPR